MQLYTSAKHNARWCGTLLCAIHRRWYACMVCGWPGTQRCNAGHVNRVLHTPMVVSRSGHGVWLVDVAVGIVVVVWFLPCPPCVCIVNKATPTMLLNRPASFFDQHTRRRRPRGRPHHGCPHQPTLCASRHSVLPYRAMRRVAVCVSLCAWGMTPWHAGCGLIVFVSGLVCARCSSNSHVFKPCW